MTILEAFLALTLCAVVIIIASSLAHENKE
jgi:hypothetical protein